MCLVEWMQDNRLEDRVRAVVVWTEDGFTSGFWLGMTVAGGISVALRMLF